MRRHRFVVGATFAFGVAVLFGCPNPSGAGSGADDPVTRVDFEQTSDLDYFEIDFGANLDPSSSALSTYEIDSAHAASGLRSLRLAADDQTQRFYFLGLPLDLSAQSVTVTYQVRGENLRVEGGQFNNAYVKIITRSGGIPTFDGPVSYSGTFDWTNETITLDVPQTAVDSFELGLFLSKSGEFWIDDITIEYTY